MNINKELVFDIALILLIGAIGIFAVSLITSDEIVEGDDVGATYEMFYVDDAMPCIYADGDFGGGLSCDWSRWKGE